MCKPVPENVIKYCAGGGKGWLKTVHFLYVYSIFCTFGRQMSFFESGKL